VSLNAGSPGDIGTSHGCHRTDVSNGFYLPCHKINKANPMKRTYIAPLLAALALVVSAHISKVEAQNVPQNQNQNPNQPRRQKKPTPTTIDSITATTITVKDAKAPKTYWITNLTVVTYEGNLANLSDLKPGMRVDITVGMNPTTAERISADAAPKPKETPTPKETPAAQ
jgi:hypothetical protein